MAEPASKFQNTSPGVAGAVKLDLDGKPQGVPVRPKGEVWLTEQEQILTANAPRNEQDNPFTNGTFTLIAKGSELGNQRPIGDDQNPQGTSDPDPEPTSVIDPEEIDLREETLEPAAEQPPAPPAPEPEEKPEEAQVPVPAISQEPQPSEKPVAVNPEETPDGTVKAVEPPAPKPAPKPLPPKAPSGG